MFLKSDLPKASQDLLAVLSFWDQIKLHDPSPLKFCRHTKDYKSVLWLMINIFFAVGHSYQVRWRCLFEGEELEGGCNRTSNFGSKMTLSMFWIYHKLKYQRALSDGSFRDGFKNLEVHRGKALQTDLSSLNRSLLITVCRKILGESLGWNGE